MSVINKLFLGCLLMTLCGFLSAQSPATIECRTGEGIGEKLHLFRVLNGVKVSIAEAVYHQNGYYGFRFIPEYEGFYVIGNERSYQYPVYLKGGETVSLYMDKDTVYLEGKKNTKENVVLFNWVALSRNIEAKSVRFFRVHSTYKDFFPEFEAFLPRADRFKEGIKTSNPRFNELMKRSIDFEKDLYALTFLYTPRSEHPQKEQYIAYYSTIVNADKFKDDAILDMPYGMDLVNRYILYASLQRGQAGGAFDRLSLIPDNRVKGELLVGQAMRLKSYFELKKFIEENERFLNDAQRELVEERCSEMYEAQKGQVAADFTYPDFSGKQISLADFKGKVVLVDVWATWCGPCRGELPHLKKLEEEMKGKEVVFIGVSVDEAKDRAKWNKFIVDEQLPGIQLFASGWSKITKDYKIEGIPRFMVFDREGKIVDATAPRPSNPALKALLEEVLDK